MLQCRYLTSFAARGERARLSLNARQYRLRGAIREDGCWQQYIRHTGGARHVRGGLPRERLLFVLEWRNRCRTVVRVRVRAVACACSAGPSHLLSSCLRLTKCLLPTSEIH